IYCYGNRWGTCGRDFFRFLFFSRNKIASVKGHPEDAETTKWSSVDCKEMRIGSGGARPQEERAAQVQSDLEHDVRSCRPNELEQPLDLLAFLHDSYLRLCEGVRLVEGGVLRDHADPTQLCQGCGVKTLRLSQPPN